MDDELTFDLSAASWRRSMADEKAFVQALAVRLEQALPGMARVERKHHWFSKEETVEWVEVVFESVVFRLDYDQRHGVTTEKSKVVRGIRLKTEALSFEDWLTALSEELRDYAVLHTNARDALERFLFS